MSSCWMNSCLLSFSKRRCCLVHCSTSIAQSHLCSRLSRCRFRCRQVQVLVTRLYGGCSRFWCRCSQTKDYKPGSQSLCRLPQCFQSAFDYLLKTTRDWWVRMWTRNHRLLCWFGLGSSSVMRWSRCRSTGSRSLLKHARSKQLTPRLHTDLLPKRLHSAWVSSWNYSLNNLQSAGRYWTTALLKRLMVTNKVVCDSS